MTIPDVAEPHPFLSFTGLSHVRNRHSLCCLVTKQLAVSCLRVCQTVVYEQFGEQVGKIEVFGARISSDRVFAKHRSPTHTLHSPRCVASLSNTHTKQAAKHALNLYYFTTYSAGACKQVSEQ